VFAVLDQVELGEIFVADGKNLNLETISEQLFGIQTTLNNTLFRIISISSALYFQRPTDLGLQALLTDSIDSMSRTIQTSRYTYSSSNSILSFEAFVSMHVSGSTLLVLFRTGSTLQIHYNFSISVQPSAYISEQVQDFTWTTANQTVLSKQFRFWPQSISNDFAYVIMTLPWNITAHPKLQNILAKRGAICLYFSRNSTSSGNVCFLEAVHLSNVSCKCTEFGHIVAVYNDTIDNVPDVVTQLSIDDNPISKICSMQTIPPLIVRLLDNSGFIVTTIESNVSVTLISEQSQYQNITLTKQPVYRTTSGFLNISDLRVDKIGTYRLQVQLLEPLLSIQTKEFDIIFGPSAAIKILRWPSYSISGEHMTEYPIIAVTDAGENVITDVVFLISLSAAFGINMNGKTLEETNLGIASFATFIIYTEGIHNMTFTEEREFHSISRVLIVHSGAPKYLNSKTVQSKPAVTGGIPFLVQPSLVFLDVGNNTATSTQESVTCFILSSQANVSAATLLGNTSVAAVMGVVQFRDLAIDISGVYVLKFFARNNLSAESEPISVKVGFGHALKLNQRPLDVSGGNLFPLNVTVIIVDRGSNMVVNNDTVVIAHLFQGGQARALGGSTAVHSLQGKASFIDLFVNVSGLGYFIQFTALDLVTVLSPTFSVTIGPAHMLQLVSAPNTSFGGLPFEKSVVVYAEDKGGNKLNARNATISLNQSNLELEPALLKFTGNRLATIMDGIAVFDDLILFMAGSNSLSVSVDNQVVFFIVQVFESSLAYLDFFGLSVIQKAGQSFSFCIVATDKGQNGLSNISVSLAFFPSFRSSTSVYIHSISTSIMGKACFEDVKLNISGNIVLHAYALSNQHVVETNVTIYVDHASLSSLILLHPIAYASTNELIQPAPLIVALQDMFGNVLVSFVGEVTVNLQVFHDAVIPKAHAFLNGIVSSSVAHGLASFDISINASGIYSLLFSCNGSINMTSEKITVFQDGISSIQIIRNPTNSTAGLNLKSQPAIVVFDKHLRVHSGSFKVTAELVSISGEGVLFGDKEALHVNGNASFTNLFIDKIGLYKLQFKFGTFVALSKLFEIVPGTPTSLSVLVQPTKTLNALDFFSVAVKITDFVGNMVPIVQMVNISSSTNKSRLIGLAFVVSVNGVATFKDLAIIDTGSLSLIFTSTNVSPVESHTFEVFSGKLKLIQYYEQPDSASCGIPWSHELSVIMLDIGGNLFERGINISAIVHSFFGDLMFNSSKNIIASQTTYSSTGHARFVGLRSIHIGRNILSFHADGIVNVSNPFNVTVGPAHTIIILQQPSSGSGGIPLLTQPILRIVDACNNSISGPLLIEVEARCDAKNSSAILRLGIYHVSDVSFEDLTLNISCSHSFLLFTCVACGFNYSNITSRSTFFDVRIGTLRYIEFSEAPAVQKVSGQVFILPVVLLFDAGFNQLLNSGHLLH
jgi:hypothetical protein